MADITRREAIAGSVVLAGFVAVAAGFATIAFDNSDGNHGGNPKDEHHPNPHVDRAFDPKYIMLLYVDIEDSYKDTSNPPQDISDIIRVRAVRLHFKTVDSGTSSETDNTWKTNQKQIVDWINALNAGANPTQDIPNLYVKPGLKELIFGQSHHIIIYVQNSNIDFDPDHPVWFGDRRLKPGLGPKPEKAAENWSFFAASVETPMQAVGGTQVPAITGNFSKKFIYMKNFFTRRDMVHNYHAITDKQSYAMNINAIINVTDLQGGDADTSGGLWANRIPVIIDPDTGNMGGGEP